MRKPMKQYGLRCYTDSSGIRCVARGNADDWERGVNVSASVDVETFLARNQLFQPVEFAVLAVLWAYHSVGRTSMPRTIAADIGIPKIELDNAVVVVAADAGIDAQVSDGRIRWTKAPTAWLHQKLYVRVSVRELATAKSATDCRMLVLLRGVAVREPKSSYLNKAGLHVIDVANMATWGGHCVDLGRGAKAIRFALPLASRALAIRAGTSIASVAASSLTAVMPLVGRFEMSMRYVDGALVVDAQRLLSSSYDHSDTSVGWQSIGKGGKALAKSAILDGEFEGISLTVDALRARKVCRYAAGAYGLAAGLQSFRRLWLASVTELVDGVKTTPNDFPWTRVDFSAKIGAVGATEAFELHVLLIASRSDQDGDSQPLLSISVE